MQKKQVAVIDVGSSKITVAIGERGINRTFVIKGRQAFNYDGFSEGKFFNLEGLVLTIDAVCDYVKKTARGNLGGIYVGVPGDFTRVLVRDSQISFTKKKRITETDVDALFDAAFVSSFADFTLINRSAVVYELDDYRKLAYPVGSYSEILKGKLSFVFCANYFYNIFKSAFNENELYNVEFISTAHAEAMYLVDAETRDRIAQILDVGYITTTFTIIQGDGILYQKSFDYGGGFITAALTEKFDMDFDNAEALKKKVNLSRVSVNTIDVIDIDDGRYYNNEEVKSTVKQSLDELCEKVANAIESSGFVIPEYVPLKITGGGVACLRGAKEYVSNRLNLVVEILAPKVPMMEQVVESSLLSLLDLALEQV